MHTSSSSFSPIFQFFFLFLLINSFSIVPFWLGVHAECQTHGNAMTYEIGARDFCIFNISVHLNEIILIGFSSMAWAIYRYSIDIKLHSPIWIRTQQIETRTQSMDAARYCCCSNTLNGYKTCIQIRIIPTCFAMEPLLRSPWRKNKQTHTPNEGKSVQQHNSIVEKKEHNRTTITD